MSPSPVVVVPYDPMWPAELEALRSALASMLADAVRAQPTS